MQNTLTYPISQRAISLIKFPKISLKFFWILSFLLMGALLVFYIFQLTLFISAEHQVQNYQRKINDLSQENRVLKINSARTTTLENITKQAQEMGFVKIEKIYYIQALDRLAIVSD